MVEVSYILIPNERTGQILGIIAVKRTVMCASDPADQAVWNQKVNKLLTYRKAIKVRSVLN